MKPLPLLDSLLAPADLRKFSPEQLAQLAEEIRYRIKETTSEFGGHLASNLGVVELTLALHRVFDFSSDRLLWDVGHQAYPHKLITGRAKVFNTNRQQGGLSGFPDPLESPYDLAKVGHSSTSISTGVGVSEGYRKQSQSHRRTVVVIGDGALTGGMAFEGLINAGQLKSDLLVVLNDNGNFIDAPVGSLHHHLDRIRTGQTFRHLRSRFMRVLKRIPRGNGLEKFAEQMELAAHKLITPGYIFEDLGFSYYGPVDGHDLATTEDLLRRIVTIKGPLLLHVVTKKGGGWEPSTKDPLKFHGPKGFDLDSGIFLPVKKGRTYSQIFADTTATLASNDPRVVAITAAMPSGTGLRAVAQRTPDIVYDVGICEQHSFAFAEGLAISGMLPVVAHYSTFAQRGFDQLFQEIVLQRNLGIVVTLDRAGLVGEDGETHHGLYDISWSRCFPGLVLMAPKDGGELEAMLRWCHTHRQQADRAAGYLIRYPKDEVPQVHWSSMPIALGRAEVLTTASAAAGKLMVWAYGAPVKTAWDALATLGVDAERVTLVNARFAKPIDSELFQRLAAQHDTVLTIEDHALPGGFGSVVAETMTDLGLTNRLYRVGVRDELIPHASREQQLAEQGLDVLGVAKRIRQILGTATAEPLVFTRTA